MLKKSSLIKIAVAVLAVAVIWFVLKLRKSSKASPPVIVTAMPVMNGPSGYVDDTPLDDGDDDFGDVPAQKEGVKEKFDWDADESASDEEGYTEYSPTDFNTDLLA